MGSRYEVEVTVGAASNLKNVNWRNGDLKPYAVLWVDSGSAKVSTRVDLDHGESPSWDEKVLVPLPPTSRLQDAVLYLDVVHANAAQGVKPLVGSARLPLRDVLDDAGVGGGKASRNLRLKRPSGRPQGRLDVRVAVREPSRYYDGNQGGYPAPAGYPGAGASRDAYGGYGGAAPGGYGAGAPAAGVYGSTAGYPASYGSTAPAYGAAPLGYGAGAAAGGYGAGAGYPASYGSAAPAYGAPPPPQPAYGSAYGSSTTTTTAYVDPAKKKKGLGVGGGLAVGAAAGVLGGLALAGGASYLEDKFEERVAERVEENQYGGGGGYDDYGGGDDGDY